jgi:hypothetical protein
MAPIRTPRRHRHWNDKADGGKGDIMVSEEVYEGPCNAMQAKKERQCTLRYKGEFYEKL